MDISDSADDDYADSVEEDDSISSQDQVTGKKCITKAKKTQNVSFCFNLDSFPMLSAHVVLFPD